MHGILERSPRRNLPSRHVGFSRATTRTGIDWARVIDVIVFEIVRFRLSTRKRLVGVYENMHPGER